MALEVTQTAGLLARSGGITIFDSGCDEITNNTDFDEGNSAVVQIADGTAEMELPITGMDVSKLMYLKATQAIKVKVVPPGGSALTTTEYTLTPNLASFIGFEIEKLYVKNDSGEDAQLIQAYIGVNT
jgi:hypothetical protein